jgi:rubredoxin
LNPTAQQRCTWCGYVYDAAAGDPARGVAPGTPFDALPETWCCPDCRAPQADFVLAEGLAFPERRKSA